MMSHSKEKTAEICLKGFENKKLDDASELPDLK
jgi:hypothetical protein